MFSRISRRIASRSFTSSSRRLGGGGHHDAAHHNKPLGPYEVPHHATYPNEAYLFGINPNAKYQSEGWEWVTLLTYIFGAGIMIAGATSKELDSFKKWARNEALAREQVIENGGEVEFGKYYNVRNFKEESVDAAPIHEDA